ncbi:hypothetical protein MBLNU230_g0860t1 [Neophaeotheca triangularis]
MPPPPPTYEESASTYRGLENHDKSDARDNAWSIQEEVGLSRTQHVASVAAGVESRVRARARQGLSTSKIALLPSGQSAGREGQLVGFPDGETPIIVQLEGQLNSVEFWWQDVAVEELRRQLRTAVGHEDSGLDYQPPIVDVREKPAAKKTSFFSRKESKMMAARLTEPVKAVTTVDVALEDLFFRTETDLGLFETVRAQALMVAIDLR